MKTENHDVQLFCEIDDALTYAIVHNGTHLIRDICVKNNAETDLENLVIRISTSNDLVENSELRIEKMKAGEELHFKNVDVAINIEYLASLTERSICQLTVGIYSEETPLASHMSNITAFAFDQWPGLQYSPEFLTAFVTPNHPVIAGLLQLAAKYLEKWTDDPSLAGYQYRDPNRVKNMAAAVYAAIQQKNVIYAEPPTSFEEFGQRIRLADAIMDQHMATCMDITLLYVACLEAMGLNPVMVMMEGHIFAGVWLIEENFSELIMDDPSQLEKRMSKGIHELLVVECTAMCAGKSMSFDKAAALAEYQVSDYDNFAFVIDVKRARSMGIRPLPVRIKTADGFEIQHDERNEKDVTEASKKAVNIIDLPDSSQKDIVTKQTQWERKLLDLSLRNMLINMRMTKTVVPLLASDVSVLEDALSDGEEFRIMPRPTEMSISDNECIQVDTLRDLGPFADFIALESRHKRLHSPYAERELNSCLTKMYRSAKTSMEENGVSTLYLALGLLRWFENKKDAPARYAPIVLVPIDIIRKSASKGYAMCMRDEDAQINITLLEFLKQNYGIQMKGLNPPPMDEHGLDIPKIFAIFTDAVMNIHMWKVVEVGVVGNFSFSQFVMWNDIHNNSAFLEKNKIVRSLINGAIEWDCTIPESVDTDEAYLPVTVDSSQLRAINMAAAGVSFVLHGPPGTGKSQTITAMIANALTKGKTVLFVAEKMAALEVVQKRLTALGIQDFCLELHSNKATKKAALDQLRRGLEISAWGTETDYNRKIQEIQNMRSDLDAYAKALHEKRPFGKSLRQLMDMYEMIPELNKDIAFDQAYAESLTEGDLDHQLQSLERLIAAGKGIGHPYNHPLSAVHQTEYSQRLKFNLEHVIREYASCLEKFRDTMEVFAERMETSTPDSENEIRDICSCARGVIDSEEIPDFLLFADDIDRAFEEPMAYLKQQESFHSKREEFLAKWNENFLRMDMNVFHNKYDQANKKFFKGRALAALTSEIQAYANFTALTDQIPVYLTDITFYQQEQKRLADVQAALSHEWKNILQEYSSCAALREYKEQIENNLQMISKVSDKIRDMERVGILKNCIQEAKMLLNDLQALQNAETQAADMLKLEFKNTEPDWLNSRLELCRCILENAASIKDWIVYRQFASECGKGGLLPVCDAYEAGLPHDEVITVYLRSVYRAIILAVIEKEPVLNSFTGIGFNEKILQFKKLDQEFMELTKDEMLYKLTHQLPTSLDSVEVSRELNILRRAISSNGRGLSIRTLFEQIPHILTRLCPCMLMSPISAAQYLKSDNDLFDIVIFDEASQLPTCKAVGVLARGKNAVIVGDPNQMPPTSFFAGNTVDEDNLDIEDLDSILDDCLALGMPSAYLRWHYRSRHESLIAFSNREFYENSMLTFPSVNDREKRVSLVKVNGFFERGKGRVNEGEAKAIVEEIKKRYRNPKFTNQTVGIVTFNISQQTLIEDLLLEEFQKDADFDKWANMREEPMFVKNLENVQGDERDVILFSIAFGPNEEGKLLLNFGPLNKAGGWKRLNVAVSRARSEMVVFTTMTADMIDLRRTKSKGVEALKNFLEFAQNGKLQGEHKETGVQKDQGIMEHICKAIMEAGYKYEKAVGHSKFKVDIAVVNPYNEEEYLLGIMLDGENYRRSANTKDREVAQISVLKGLGWELYRIWTMDWWDNRDKELSKFMHFLEERKGKAQQAETEKQVALEQKTDSAKYKAFAGIAQVTQMHPEYRAENYTYAKIEVTDLATADYVKSESMKQIADKMQQIIDLEAPIAYERLIKKTLRAFNIARSSTQTLEATDRALKKVSAKTDMQNGVRFYWRNDQKPDLYRVFRVDTDSRDKRSPDEICQQELKNAVCLTLKERGKLDKDTLIRETIRSMGYARSGTALTAAVERGMKYGQKMGEIGENENNIYLRLSSV